MLLNAFLYLVYSFIDNILHYEVGTIGTVLIKVDYSPINGWLLVTIKIQLFYMGMRAYFHKKSRLSKLPKRPLISNLLYYSFTVSPRPPVAPCVFPPPNSK